jgi:nucleotide-binding universal stress UspA family protein
MKSLDKIIVPTDLTDGSRRAIEYAASLAAENKGQLLILHIANEFAAWELHDDFFGYSQTWPLDHVLNEAAIELNRFLEHHSASLNRVHTLHKRIALASIHEKIVATAAEEKADLIVLAPRRHRGWHSLFTSGITEKVTRLSPCPVLSIAPSLPSQRWRGKFLPISLGCRDRVLKERDTGGVHRTIEV